MESTESQRARRVAGPGRLPALIAAMTALGASLHVLYIPATIGAGVPFRLPWWLLCAAFVATDVTIVHLHTERDAHTITLSEIPLVMGLAFVSPPALVVARLAGSAVALGLVRRQPLNKLVFNLSLTYLETVTVVVLARAVAGAGIINRPVGWLAVLLAVGVGSMVTSSLVALAISMHDPLGGFDEVWRSLGAGTVVNVGTALVGLVAMVTLWHEPWAALVLGAFGALFFLGVRVYGSLTRRHDDLRAIYSFTRALDGSLSADGVLDAAAAEARHQLRCEFTEIVVFDGAKTNVAVRVDVDGTETRRTIDVGGSGADAAGDLGSGGGFVTGHDELGRRHGIPLDRPAIAAPIIVTDETVGYIVAGLRQGPVGRFDGHDLELLEALAKHLSATLEASWAIRRLEDEVEEKRRVIESKDQLIAAVSHELRTPLTGLLGYAELLGEGGDVAAGIKHPEMISVIASEAWELSTIVEDLLTAARVDQGRLVVSPEPLDLADVAEALVGEWSRRSGVPVTYVASGADAHGDPQRIRQILRNLLQNAVRYGGGEVRVRCDESGRWARIHVADAGPGIPEDQRELVFDPYYSAHRPGSQPGSVGLGLSIGRSLARLMDGDLTYSVEGGWSVFTLSLPRAPAHAAGGAEPLPSLVMEVDRG